MEPDCLHVVDERRYLFARLGLLLPLGGGGSSGRATAAWNNIWGNGLAKEVISWREKLSHPALPTQPISAEGVDFARRKTRRKPPQPESPLKIPLLLPRLRLRLNFPPYPLPPCRPQRMRPHHLHRSQSRYRRCQGPQSNLQGKSLELSRTHLVWTVLHIHLLVLVRRPLPGWR